MEDMWKGVAIAGMWIGFGIAAKFMGEIAVIGCVFVAVASILIGIC